MLFVSLMKQIPGTNEESSALRLQWDNPEGGVKIIGEYWLQTADPAVVAIVEADSVSQIMMTLAGWSNYFETSVYPAVTAEEGMELLKMMFSE